MKKLYTAVCVRCGDPDDFTESQIARYKDKPLCVDCRSAEAAAPFIGSIYTPKPPQSSPAAATQQIRVAAATQQQRSAEEVSINKPVEPAPAQDSPNNFNIDLSQFDLPQEEEKSKRIEWPEDAPINEISRQV